MHTLVVRLLVIPLLAALVLSTPAGAALRLCKADPIVGLNGQRVQVLVAIPEEYVPLVNNPTRVEIKTPQQVTRELLFLDSGFNGMGEDFSFSDIGDGYGTSTGYMIWTKVTVPITTSDIVPIQVEVIGADGTVQTFYGNHTGTEFYVAITDAAMAGVLAAR